MSTTAVRSPAEFEGRRVPDVLLSGHHAEVRKWQELSAEGRSLTGTPSGFADLDAITGGFQPGNLIIIAARPSMGKSGLGLCMAANLAVREERPVALFTLEMSKAEVTQRLMCAEGKVESQRLRTGKLAPESEAKAQARELYGAIAAVETNMGAISAVMAD